MRFLSSFGEILESAFAFVHNIDWLTLSHSLVLYLWKDDSSYVESVFPNLGDQNVAIPLMSALMYLATFQAIRSLGTLKRKKQDYLIMANSFLRCGELDKAEQSVLLINEKSASTIALSSFIFLARSDIRRSYHQFRLLHDMHDMPYTKEHIYFQMFHVAFILNFPDDTAKELLRCMRKDKVSDVLFQLLGIRSALQFNVNLDWLFELSGGKNEKILEEFACARTQLFALSAKIDLSKAHLDLVDKTDDFEFLISRLMFLTIFLGIKNPVAWISRHSVLWETIDDEIDTIKFQSDETWKHNAIFSLLHAFSDQKLNKALDFSRKIMQAKNALWKNRPPSANEWIEEYLKKDEKNLDSLLDKWIDEALRDF